MRRFPTTLVVILAAIVAVAGGWLLFAKAERDRYVAVDAVRRQHSEIRIDYAVEHERGPIAREEWRFENLDGRSAAHYSAEDRHGSKAAFDETIGGYDVTFLFDRLVADGIWELQTRPFRGADPDVHSVRIEQVADRASGSHAFRFSDPHYLATSAGREYHLHLDRDKPVPDLIRLDSTSSADGRYEKLVRDVEGFGSERFRRTVAEARERLRRS